MKKWYDEEYEFTVEVTGILHWRVSMESAGSMIRIVL
jgi:hypothetical protein